MKLCILLIAFCVVPAMQAQLNRPAYGIFGHYSYAIHNASFSSLPDVSCCADEFTGGSGSGFALGVLYQMPLAKSWNLSGRLSYISYPGLLRSDQPQVMNIGGEDVPGIIRHDIDASFASLNLEPLIGYRLTDRLTLHGGLSIGFVLQKSFTQTERKIEPVQGSLTVPELVKSGDLKDASSLYAGAMLGASFDIPLFRGSRWFLAPEVFYTLGFTNTVANLDWKVNTLRAGFALKYSPPPFELPPQPDPVIKLNAGVRAYGMASPDAAEEPIVRLKVEEFLSRTHKPLLPYVFFGNGSAEMPEQYHRMNSNETASFTPERFNDSTLLGVYYDMLNIIGKRMKEKPGSKLTLTGCNSNEGVEKSNLNLSQRRAENVKTYLTSVWGIEPSRIDVKSRNLPGNPSNISKEEGVVENRRVEIASNDPNIMAPLVTRDTTRIANPPIVRFVTVTESEAGVGSYSVAASQNNTLLQAFNGNGEPPEKVDWYLQDNPTSMPRAETPMQYNVRVTDYNAHEYTSPSAEIPVEQITVAKKRREHLGDKEIVRYTLMSFGFNQADVEPDNARYLEQVRQDVSPESAVHITGSTDTMGDSEFNQNLSEQRARAVAKVLKAKDSEVRGIGEQSYFDNSLPEGRFYNRTVRVLIENPVK